MKLPNQTKAVERKTYNANAVAVGANASVALTPMITRALYPGMSF